MSEKFKILVPTDFSTFAEKALDSAATLAKKLNADVYLLHIVDYSGYVLSLDTSLMNTISLNEMYKNIHDTSEEQLQKLIDNEKYIGVNIIPVIDSGLAADEIISYQKEKNIDLIVIGTKGANDLADELIGTLTDKIIRRSHCPVMSIHDTTNIENINAVAIASNFKKDLGPLTDSVINIIHQLKSAIHLVRINTINDFESTRYSHKLMNSFSEKHQLSSCIKDVYDHENFSTGIYHYANDNKIDLIIMGTHGHQGFSHFFHGGSKAEDIVNHLNIPVITFRID